MYLHDLTGRAIVCSVSSINVKELKSSLENPYVMVGNKKVFTRFHFLHLLKRSVAKFLKQNFSTVQNCDTTVAAIVHIIYSTDVPI